MKTRRIKIERPLNDSFMERYLFRYYLGDAYLGHSCDLREELFYLQREYICVLRFEQDEN